MNEPCKSCPFVSKNLKWKQHNIEMCAEYLLYEKKQTEPHRCFEDSKGIEFDPAKQGEKPCYGNQQWLSEQL